MYASEVTLGGERVERRLAAVPAADIVAYSRLIGQDEAGTLSRLRALRRESIDPNIAAHHGRMVKTTGDGFLAEFSSSVDALRCACDLQARVPEYSKGAPPDLHIELRIGIHQGRHRGRGQRHLRRRGQYCGSS